MISGAHVILYSKDVDADREFFRDVLQFPSIDAGRGWLIFALPPAELAMHPADGNPSHELYLMCPDLKSVLEFLRAKHVRYDPPAEARWGTVVHLDLPSGTRIGLYEPKHPTALTLGRTP